MNKPMHTERETRTGRYAKSQPCDCCGKPVGTEFGTDEEVCGLTDGPGFYLCARKACEKKLAGLSVEQRRALYVRREHKP